MPAGLREGLHFCEIGGKFIFLDVSRDRYFMLPETTGARFSHFLTDHADADDQAWLSDAGIICNGGRVPQLAQHIETIADESLEQSLGHFSRMSVLEAVIRQHVLKRALRREKLAKLLAGIARAQQAACDGDVAVYANAAMSFKLARRFTTAIEQCLPRGMAMMQILSRRGCRAQLVFGVMLPFAAHCWVQWGPHVLTDPPDVVRPFKPILVL